MFGLGWMELLIIAGLISLFAGPTMLRKVISSARELDKAKRDLTGPGALERLLGEDEDDGAEAEPGKDDASAS